MRNKFFTDSLGCKCKVVRRKTPVGLRYTVIWCAAGRWCESHVYASTPVKVRKKYGVHVDSFLDYVFTDYYNKDCN